MTTRVVGCQGTLEVADGRCRKERRMEQTEKTKDEDEKKGVLQMTNGKPMTIWADRRWKKVRYEEGNVDLHTDRHRR
jgi:hypothetical protein